MDIPPFWTHEQLCERLLRELLIDQKKILANQENHMSSLTDLQGSVAKLKASVQAFIAANSGGATDADLQAIKADVDALEALVNPPAPAA